jgi:hypothetical protein
MIGKIQNVASCSLGSVPGDMELCKFKKEIHVHQSVGGLGDQT